MFYRENGQFKTSYAADQQIFPVVQDRLAVLCLLMVAFVAVPALAPEYLFRAILIPFLILSLAALGLNILVGYCGQISLGTGGLMAVGAYGAYNILVRIEGVPLILALLMGGVFAAVIGVLFGIPSLRIRGLYLAVATLAAQFFCDWSFLRIKWLTNHSSSGSVSVAELNVGGWSVDTPAEKYLFCLTFVCFFALITKNLIRGHIGREWMAIRDMDHPRSGHCGTWFRHRTRLPSHLDDFWILDCFLSDRRAAWARAIVGRREREAEALAFPALKRIISVQVYDSVD